MFTFLKVPFHYKEKSYKIRHVHYYLTILQFSQKKKEKKTIKVNLALEAIRDFLKSVTFSESGTYSI